MRVKKAILYFLRNKVAFKAAGADLEGNRSPPDFGFYLLEIGFPDAAGMIFRMAHLITGNRMFSANIAGP
jgi:hypothetical protein